MWSLIGDWSGAFDLRRPTVAKVWSNDEGQQWWSGQAASGRVVSLVSLYLSGCVFDWLHSHRFLYAPVRLVVFFSGVEGGWVVVVVKGGGGNSPPHTHTTTTTPLSSLHQQTPLSPDGICCPHICIVCQSCTPTPNLLLEFAHTHKHTDMLQSPALTLCKFWFLS